jgi:ATP-binding cassette, subfamily B, bacterial
MKKTTQQTLSFYWKHLKPVKLLATLNILGIIVGVIMAMTFPVLYKLIIDEMTMTENLQDSVSNLMWILGAILIVDAVATLAWRVSGYSASTLQPRVMANVADECFEVLHKHSFRFFNNNFTGSLVKKINRMSRAFEGIADQITFEFIPVLVRTSIAISVLFYLDVLLGSILLVWAIFFIIVNYIFSLYKLKHFDLPKVKADSAVTAQLADSITNHSNTKLFSNQEPEVKRFKLVTRDWYKKTKKSWFFSQHAELVQSILMIAVNITIFYFAIQLWADGKLTVGDFALIQYYLMELFRQLWDFGRNIRRFYEHLADAEEMTEILNLPVEVTDIKDANELIVNHGQIEFKNIGFSYEDDNQIMKKLSLKVKPSEKVALIGPSGGGKTTLTKLLLRLFDIQKGQVLIDGQDISQVTQESLRRNIALVPQDPVLFHRTLLENIRYGNMEASDEAVIAAAKMANCDDFIQTFPKGYKTYVGERGVKLSGGERQRIAIARAMLSNAKILILDEATSNLDSESEQLIQDALAKLTHNKTTLVIAHRLSTIVHMDRIIVLEKGKIREEGSHQTLIRTEGSLYKQLWSLQVEGYLN